MFRNVLPLVTLLLLAAPLNAAPEKLQIDPAHTFITFKASHIGFAWMPGLFRNFEGALTYDPDNPSNSQVEFSVEISSLATFHAERDKHLKSDDFLDAKKHPTATFKSTAYEVTGKDSAILRGDLAIKGATRPVEFEVTELASREDPWGNFRRAWSAQTELKLADFDIDDFGGAVETATVKIAIEATRKQ